MPIFPDGLTELVICPLHTVWFVMALTFGVGLTSIKKERGVPTQLLAVGINTTVELMVAELGLVAVNDGISPTPLVLNPIAGLLLVQVYVVPVTVGLGVMVVVVAPGQ